jgi:hypothetical protein
MQQFQSLHLQLLFQQDPMGCGRLRQLEEPVGAGAKAAARNATNFGGRPRRPDQLRAGGVRARHESHCRVKVRGTSKKFSFEFAWSGIWGVDGGITKRAAPLQFVMARDGLCALRSDRLVNAGSKRRHARSQ